MKRVALIAFALLLTTAQAVALTPNATVAFSGIPGLEDSTFPCTLSYSIQGLPRVKEMLDAGERPDQTTFISEKKFGYSLFVVKAGHEGFEVLEAQCKSRETFESVILDVKNPAGETVLTLTGTECTISAVRRVGPNDRMVIRVRRVEVAFK